MLFDHFGTRSAAVLLVIAVWISPALAVADGGGATLSLADRLKAVQSGDADHPTAKLPTWKPVGADTFNAPIPRVTGLTIAAAVNEPSLGDYESIIMITGVDSKLVSAHYSADLPKIKDSPLLARPKDLGQADPMREFPDKLSCTRTIDVADLASAIGFSSWYCAHSAEHFPGVSSISLSTEAINRLRSGQTVDFHFDSGNRWAVFAQMGAQFQGEKPTAPLLSNFGGQMMYSCRLHRVGATDVAFPTLVNGKRVLLPALHSACTLQDQQEVHFFWLDQPSNPIGLADVSSEALAQVINISFPVNPPASPDPAPKVGQGQGTNPMEQALSDKKPVQIYGIYFDFNSATIKPESEPVLQEIAAIMRKNPDWKLSVTGNTDNIGDGKSNLALSQRRAAAVKDVLVARFKIAPDRLDTSGDGASRPIETNDTLEGRARNRRVELQRE